jgi:RNA polymerase sigma factor (sigma-70 family)
VREAVDRAELIAFCEREHPRLVGALNLYCGNPDVAAEIAQEALIRAVRDWPKVGHMQSPGAWVHRVGMNLASSWFRRRSAERRALRRHGPAPEAVPDDVDLAEVRSAVAALPQRQRKVIVMRFYLGLSVAEAAAALGITEQATAALTYRATRLLRTQLQDFAMEVSPDAS